MGWDGTDPRNYQALKRFKVLLDRLTPNKAAEAELMGVRPSAVSGWCNPIKMLPQLPAALLSRHSEAIKLLDLLAYEVGYTLVPLPPVQPDGDVRDEVLVCMRCLGDTSGKVQTALRDLVSPGKIDAKEADGLLETARDLQRNVQRLVVELTAIANQEPEEIR